MKRRCTIGISDKYRFYNFIVEITGDKDSGLRAGVYVPDYEPSVYNGNVDAYRLRFAVWYGPRIDWVDVPFYRYDCLATPEFHDGGQTYNEFVPIVREAVNGQGTKVDLDKWLTAKMKDIEPSVYVSLTVLEDDGLGNLIENPSFNSGQGVILLNNKDKKYGIKIVERNGRKFIAPFGPTIAVTDTHFGPEHDPRYIFKKNENPELLSYKQDKTEEYLDVDTDKKNDMVWRLVQSKAVSYAVFRSFNKDQSQFDDVKVRAYLMDNKTGYLALEAETYATRQDQGLYYVSNISLDDLLKEFQHKPVPEGLRIQVSVTIRHNIRFEDCSRYEDEDLHRPIDHTKVIREETNQIVSYITNIIPVDDELVMSVFGNDFTIENIYDLDMNVNALIIKDVTEQNIVEMKVDGDKNHIVQPMFFRVRDAANITIHPHVKENICINLDAYKAQVESFRIKIEGVVFKEIARLEAGVVFGISGTMLPGALGTGTYYLLNEEGALVTTGKYTYEY